MVRLAPLSAMSDKAGGVVVGDTVCVTIDTEAVWPRD
jgi:hypothetical protein